MRVARFVFSLAIMVAPACCADETTTSNFSELLGKSFESADSVNIGVEASDDARDCLRGLAWEPSPFTTSCYAPVVVGCGDALVRFPSPVASGDERNDQVAMEWYVVRNGRQQPRRAPAVVVVHESGSGMTVGRMFARGFHDRGLHAFLIHLPYYGERREGRRPDDELFFTLMRQAIADARRARDAVVALPWVDESHVALQGTSLGGFVSATAAALDNGYDSVFLTLAGGDLFEMIQNGKKDTAKVRERLLEAGVAGEELRSLFSHIEPTRIAHRLDPERTWLYSGTFDSVVPMKNASALADAANLDPSHHIKMPANHYTGIIFLPAILDHMRDQIVGGKQTGHSQRADDSSDEVQD